MVTHLLKNANKQPHQTPTRVKQMYTMVYVYQTKRICLSTALPNVFKMKTLVFMVTFPIILFMPFQICVLIPTKIV